MGWFKKEVSKTAPKSFSRLPELPPLPEFPMQSSREFQKKPLQLPRFPNDSLGEKFSQNTIKEAISGKKEDEVLADEFAEEESQMMQEPQEKLIIDMPPMAKKLQPAIELASSKELVQRIRPRTKEAEPIFIQIDKFEEALQNFEKAKANVLEMEKMLQQIQKLKEEETHELASWEINIQKAKEHIEKIDQDVFSKVE
jgi:hypothetical protein